MKTRLLLAVLGVCGSATACIGSSFTEGSSGSGSGGGSTSSSASNVSVASSSSSGQSSSGMVTADCPTGEHGTFMIAASGAGCGAVASAGAECVEEDTSACGLAFGATSGQTKAIAVSGQTKVGLLGGFAGVTLGVGGLESTCDGVWNAITSTLKLTCMTTGLPKEPCTVTLTSTNAASCTPH